MTDLPLSLWAEATRTAVYIQNRSPHAILGEKTPEEVFTKKKPAVEYIRIFGTPVYIHVPKEKRDKLDTSVRKVYLLGTMIARRLIEYIYLHRGTLRSTEM